MTLGLDDFLEESTQNGQIVGCWGFNPNIDFTRMSNEEVNVWFFEQIFNFLRSFFGLVLPDSVEISTYNGKEKINKDKLDQMTFLDELMLSMKQLNAPVWSIRLNLSIVGFLRTDWDLDHPVRLQIQEPASFIIWGGPDETGAQTYSMGYRLFSEQQLSGEHNMLWSVNQSLLEKALRKWEMQSQHRIDIVESNSKQMPISSKGFSKPAPQKLAPLPPPTEEELEPVDDSIPDLDDLFF